jgi:hypothetical protein
MRLAWRAALLALVVLAVLPAVAPARVLQSFTPDDKLAEGPLLAGNRVAWEETRCESSGGCGFEADTRYRIRAGGSGGVRTLTSGRIRSLPGGSNSFFSSVSFRLSPSRFVLARSEFGTTSEQDFAAERLFAGNRDGGGLRQLFACATDQQNVVNRFALAGDRVAYDPDPCDDQARVEVRDLGGAEGSSLVLLPGGQPLADIALAGRRLAVVHAGRVLGFNTRTGAELFAAPLPPGTLHGIDVAADGRLAVSVGSQRFARRTCWRSRLWLLAAGGSALEQLPVSPCWDARLVRGGVAYLTGERRPLGLELRTTGGTRGTIVAFGTRRARESFDAQGARAAFAVGCGGRVRIRVVSIDGRSPAC